jgi:hypothetical protein
MSQTTTISMNIVRSNATKLVEAYYKTTDTMGHSEPEKDVLCEFSYNCFDTKIFHFIPIDRLDAIYKSLFIAIKNLDEYVLFKEIRDICDYEDLDIIVLPPTNKIMFMLHHAVDNYFYKKEIKNNECINIQEELLDCFAEYNICSVCKIIQNTDFYFSTIYGLDKPVCKDCIESTNYDDKSSEDSSYVEEEGSESNSETDTTINSETDTTINSETDTTINSETDTTTNSETDTTTNSESNSDSGYNSSIYNIETNSETNSETDSETEENMEPIEYWYDDSNYKQIYSDGFDDGWKYAMKEVDKDQYSMCTIL